MNPSLSILYRRLISCCSALHQLHVTLTGRSFISVISIISSQTNINNVVSFPSSNSHLELQYDCDCCRYLSLLPNRHGSYL